MRKGDGDGTVPLVSLGLHCNKQWRTKELNPAGFRVVTHEIAHEAVPWYKGIRRADSTFGPEFQPRQAVGCSQSCRAMLHLWYACCT